MSEQTPLTFADLPVAEKLRAALAKNGITNPTPIQAAAIPPALLGEDLIGIAQTGTGKTLAFGLPMIQRLAENGGKGLILLPTRELALQVDENLKRIGTAIGLRTAVLVGGENIQKQIHQIQLKPHILIATPGRMIDHLQQRTVDLSQVKVLVLDEADRMLDMGFLPQIDTVLKTLPKERQTLLFSATMPEAIVRLTARFMKTPSRIEIARAGTTAVGVTQELFVIRKEEKNQLLEHLLKEYPGSALVFTRTKHGAKRLTRSLLDMGITANELHSNRSLNQRKEALAGFKSGKYRVIVATDIAARGIDVNDITLVVNYDLPENPDDYVHRIGRTARAGKTGRAVSFATPDQRRDVQMIERLIKQEIKIANMPTKLPPARQEIRRPFIDHRNLRQSEGEGRSRDGSLSGSRSGRGRGGNSRGGSSRRGGRGFVGKSKSGGAKKPYSGPTYGSFGPAKDLKIQW